MTTLITLTRQDARRLAISRQHLDGRQRPSMLDVIRDLGCVQLDPIRAVERTHLLVLWSRLGHFAETELDRLRFEDRALFEYWAHAASLVLTEEWPVHNWYMRRVAAQTKEPKYYQAHQAVFEGMLTDIVDQLQTGPKLAKELDIQPGPTQNGRWWSGSYVGRLLDRLWTRGQLMVYGRPNNHRVWGMAEDFWPDWTPRETWNDEQLTRFATQKAIRALGVATARQIKQHYTRNRYPQLTSILSKLVDEGTLLAGQVIGDDGTALPDTWYIHQADLPLLAQIQAGNWQPRTTLLSPFDNLICDRDRTHLLWDFYFRIEIYVPKAKRQYGYYVLPVLHGDQLIGRISPKMDRKTAVLHIEDVYREPEAPVGTATGQAIGQAIVGLAQFLGANKIEWGNIPEEWSDGLVTDFG